ncbi:hypothetical protein [Micromonospora avicenniae]|uniref:Uncharacterized protein n=1 Tax=Micromonospora avicenniae TaxID=1198245 RepID=A0A1N6TPR2_9ACTN|nr:hypothetical protein [Micromonospora avicenniae]SIQ55362.1 hypothetical protein SAMN05444858_10356 [Micromonospora avicenniae]
MSYRDWGREASSPHEREPIASWDEAGAPAPADPYLPDERPGPPSRRQARDREQDEHVDAYLPRWAIDSGIRRPDGGGRHAAPDDDGDGAVRPSSGEGRRTDRAGGRRRAHGTGWRDVPSPELEHTAEWTFDRPQERGYVGRRRADPADDAWFPGSIAARRAEATEPAYQPAVDPWDASGMQAVPAAIEVDPWDASGVHAWPAVGGDRGHGTGQWKQPEGAGRWEQPSRRRTDAIGAHRGTRQTPPRRRVDTVASDDWARRLEDDLLDADPVGTLRSLLYTTACYLIPAVLVFAWLLTLDARPPAGCVTDITGGGCGSPRAHVLGSLIAAAPRYGVALASSLVVAALLRKVGTTWRSTTVALASAVVGGGLSTVLISAVTGQPVG